MFWKALDVLFKKVSQRYGPKIKTVETTKVKVIFGLKTAAILDFGPAHFRFGPETIFFVILCSDR